MRDTAHTLTSSARRFFSGTLLSRLTGFGREVMMAFYFGAAPAVGAFWMAFRFAHLLRRLFGEGALHLAFVPHFEALRQTDPQKAGKFFYDLSVALIGILAIIVLVVESILWKYQGEVICYMRWLLPAIIPIVLYALNISFLNCERSYFLPSVAPVALNVVWMGALFWLRHQSVSAAMLSLSAVLGFAFLLQWAVTLPRVLKQLRQRLYQPIDLRSLGRVIRPFTLAVIGVTATQINSALDAIFAQLADPSGPAYLWYALRLQQLPLALFGVATASALLPPLSRSLSRGEIQQGKHLLEVAIGQTFEWMVPITGAFVLLAPALIQSVYGYGAFDQLATQKTAGALQAYALGLLPMTLVMILAAPYYARKSYGLPTTAAIASVGLNIGLNTLFVFAFGWGTLSVALSTTLSALINALVLALASKQPLIGRHESKLFLCTAVAAGGTWMYAKEGLCPAPLIQLMSEAGLYTLLFFVSLWITKTSYGVLKIRKRSEYG